MALRSFAIVVTSSSRAWERTDLRDLIGHKENVHADMTLEEVHKLFGSHEREFMAVLDGERVIGVCSRHDIGMCLGARYGFSLFSRKPVREFLSRQPAFVRLGQPIGEVLEIVFSRASDSFYDDVVLLDEAGGLAGLIHVHTLVRLQTQALRSNIVQLEAQQRVIREKNRQMEDDLVMAREIQLAMLPQGQLVFPSNGSEEEECIRFAHLYRPAGNVGGDFVHVIPISPTEIGVFVSDVMGHGVRSALVTAMLRAMVEEIGSACTDPGLVLAQLNRALAGIIRQAGDMMYATALYLVADIRAGRVRFATAGHPGPIVMSRISGRIEHIVCPRGVGGPGLCIFDDARYGVAEFALEGDDIVLLFTDGLIEASNPAGELFGVERVCETMQQADGRADLPVILDGIVAASQSFCGGADFEDDVCLAALHLTTASAPLQMNGTRREEGFRPLSL
ncbi:MAG TPA: SpoIIE family protein phosphatase [Chthoniobacterales bacterium]